MKELIKSLLPKNRFAHSVSVLAGGTAAGQAIVVLTSPLLTRLYSPEDFGLLAVYTSLLMIIGVVATLRFQLAIPLPEDDQEAAHIVVLCLLVVLGMTVCTALVVLFFRESIAEAVNTPVFANYLWLLPVGLVLMGTYQVFNFWAIRIKAFPAIARTKLTQSLSLVGVQIGGYALGPLSLLLGQVVGQAAGSISLAAHTMPKRWPAFQAVTSSGIFEAARRYRHFPIYSTWGGAFNTAGTQLPPLLFAALFSPTAAGLYMLAHRIMSLPMTLIGEAIADVFFASAAEACRDNTLGKLVATLHQRLVQIAMPPALVLFFTGPDLFALFFGADWRAAGEMARWLTPMLYIQFIVSPLSRIFVVLERQALGTVLQGLLFVSRISSLATVAALGGDIMVAVFVYGLTSAISFSIYLLVIVYVSGDSLLSAFTPSLWNLPVAILLVTPVFGFSFFSRSGTVLFISSLIVTSMLIMLYYLYLLRSNSGFKEVS